MDKIKLAAFLDEIEKIALGPFETNALVSGALGAHSLAKHGPWAGGQSSPELTSGSELAAAQGQQEQAPVGTPEHEQAKEQLRTALKKHHRNVSAAEAAGAGLLGAGVQGAGIFAGNRIGDSIMSAEKGMTTDAPTAAKLVATAKPTVPVHYVANATADHAISVPKGGFMPKLLRGYERGLYERDLGGLISEGLDQSTPEAKTKVREHVKSSLNKMIDEGGVILPAKAGPYVAAHELGHEAFGRSGLGKAVRAVRLPAAVGGMIGGGIMASQDPDSTAAKWAPAVGAASVAPTLGEEAFASIRGMGILRKAGTDPAMLRKARSQMLKSWGTYGAMMGAPAVAAPYLIRKFKQRRKAQREAAGLPTSTALKAQLEGLDQ